MIGDVLRHGDPEPDEGTPLLDAKGHVEPYRGAEIGGRWDRYVAKMGPFVVAPDYDAAIAEAEGTPAAEVPTDDVTALGVAVYVPTLVRAAVQAATVVALDSLSSLTRLVDAVPVDSVADEPCGNDRAHGAATVYGGPCGGPCGGLCLPCAVVAVRAAPWDATDPAVVSLDVLRHPAVTR